MGLSHLGYLWFQHGEVTGKVNADLMWIPSRFCSAMISKKLRMEKILLWLILSLKKVKYVGLLILRLILVKYFKNLSVSAISSIDGFPIIDRWPFKNVSADNREIFKNYLRWRFHRKSNLPSATQRDRVRGFDKVAGRFGKKMDLPNWICRIDIMPKWYCRFGKTCKIVIYSALSSALLSLALSSTERKLSRIKCLYCIIPVTHTTQGGSKTRKRNAKRETPKTRNPSAKRSQNFGLFRGSTPPGGILKCETFAKPEFLH
jgi:hypothetical protein